MSGFREPIGRRRVLTPLQAAIARIEREAHAALKQLARDPSRRVEEPVTGSVIVRHERGQSPAFWLRTRLRDGRLVHERLGPVHDGAGKQPRGSWTRTQAEAELERRLAAAPQGQCCAVCGRPVPPGEEARVQLTGDPSEIACLECENTVLTADERAAEAALEQVAAAVEVALSHAAASDIVDRVRRTVWIGGDEGSDTVELPARELGELRALMAENRARRIAQLDS
jgi:hypothetical protein